MRSFILSSRTGRTDAAFPDLRRAGRLDLVYQCALMALFTSHGHRKDTVFTACLAGPPSAPLAVSFDGGSLRDVRTDERTWESLLRKVLSGNPHPGVTTRRASIQEVVGEADEVFVLHERGEPIETVAIEGDPTFLLGDHVGLPKKDEAFALRHGTKVSLGKRRYLAAAAIAAVHYTLDRREVAA